jgi:tRNA modification GTPase
VFSTDDTIVALATPRGRGGIGVVRVSGPDAYRIGCALMARRTPLRPRHATLGHVIDPQAARAVDQVVVTYFKEPESYTCEDVVEISAHGSPPLLERIVELAMRAGARLAEPGEFTLRAFLNGRLDLIQAEAVGDLVDAVTPLQARAAMDQLDGTLTARIASIERELFDLTARLEASLDFPDEGFHFLSETDARDGLAAVREAITTLIGAGRAGRVIREGSLVVIVGAPNAGKSSLFNALLGRARAIVTDLPGTTRDVLSEAIDLDGLAVTIVDTAGLRTAADAIEAEGIRRAEQVREIATVTLLAVDRSVPLDRSQADLERADLVVACKADLPGAWTAADVPDLSPRTIEVSSTTGEGIDRLRRRLVGALTANEHWTDPPAVSNMRHLRLLGEAEAAIARASEALAAGSTEELLLAEIAHGRQALEAVTGRTTADDLLHHIFGRFCVGK